MIPGTYIELSRLGVRRVHDQVFIHFGILGVLALVLSEILGVLLLVTLVILTIAGLVFAIQALVVGSQILDDEKYASCRAVAQWMLVFGSFVLTGFFCSCCCENRSRAGETPAVTWIGVASRFVHLFNFIWTCYGMYIVTNPGSYPTCSPSQYSVFTLMVLFMFWGSMTMIILISCLALLLWPILPVLRAGKRDGEHEDDDEHGPLAHSDDELLQDD